MLTREEIFEAVMRLSDADRAELANRILETLPPNDECWSFDDPEFIAEMDRRSGDWNGSITWEELRDQR